MINRKVSEVTRQRCWKINKNTGFCIYFNIVMAQCVFHAIILIGRLIISKTQRITKDIIGKTVSHVSLLPVPMTHPYQLSFVLLTATFSIRFALC